MSWELKLFCTGLIFVVLGFFWVGIFSNILDDDDSNWGGLIIIGPFASGVLMMVVSALSAVWLLI